MCRKNSNEKWKITGIVSITTECGHPKRPGVLVNVPYYRKWIDDRTEKCRFNNTSH
jgi:secreted trypsin-like serine protease